jgi:hypothetical protein
VPFALIYYGDAMTHKLIFIFLAALLMQTHTLYDFSKEQDWSEWEIENDTVMGGRSSSELVKSDAGNALFKGSISLENNGGFASVQYHFAAQDMEDYSKAILRIKGDGKRYQFRIKANLSDNYSFIYYFETTGEWQTVEIQLSEMYPVYRGKDVDRPNFDANHIEEVRFLIGNKEAQDFVLGIDKIMFE